MSESPTVVQPPRGSSGLPGLTGTLYGLIFLLVGRRNARVNEIAGVGAGDHVVDIGAVPAMPPGWPLGAARGSPASTRQRRCCGWPVRSPAARHRPGRGGAEALRCPTARPRWCGRRRRCTHWRDVTRGACRGAPGAGTAGRLLVVERQSPPDATGVAGHGWTAAQADSLPLSVASAGLRDVTVEDKDSTWVVLGYRP